MNDLFDSGRQQLGFDLGDTAQAPCYEPDRAEIRAELNEILSAAREAADEAPWDERTFLLSQGRLPADGALAAGRRTGPALLRVCA